MSDPAAAEAMKIDLTTDGGCRIEVQNCSRGLAMADHLFGQAVDALSDAEVTWGTVESEAAKAARENASSAATATEIRGLITEYVNARPSARQAFDQLSACRNTKTKIERWMRSVEKRMSAAQSALKSHEALGRYGGGN